MPTNGKRRLHVEIDEQLAEQLTEAAAANGTTLAEEVRHAIKDRLYFLQATDRGMTLYLEYEDQSGPIRERERQRLI